MMTRSTKTNNTSVGKMCGEAHSESPSTSGSIIVTKQSLKKSKLTIKKARRLLNAEYIKFVAVSADRRSLVKVHNASRSVLKPLQDHFDQQRPGNIPQNIEPSASGNIIPIENSARESIPTKVKKSRESRRRRCPRVMLKGVARGGWNPTPEDKELLYSDGSFMIESHNYNSGKLPEDVVIFRIWELEFPFLIAQVFAPIDVNGRKIHYGTSKFFIVTRNDAFYSKFYPVYTYVIAIADETDDDAAETFVQYFNIERILPCLSQIRQAAGTEQSVELFTAMRVVCQAIMWELMKPGGFIKQAVLEGPQCEQYYKNYWNLLSHVLTNRAETVLRSRAVLPQGVSSIREYPLMKLSRWRVKEAPCCSACGSVKKNGTFRADFNFKAYDPLDFTDVGLTPGSPKYIMVCDSCKYPVIIVHRLLHHKWGLYVAVRQYIEFKIGELGPDEGYNPKELIESLLVHDYEWCIRSFVKLQVVLAESDRYIARL